MLGLQVVKRLLSIFRGTGLESRGVGEPAMTTFGPFGDPLRPVLSMVHIGRLLRLTMCAPARCVGHWGGTNDLEFEPARAATPSSSLSGPGRPSLRSTCVQCEHIIHRGGLKATHSNCASIATRSQKNPISAAQYCRRQCYEEIHVGLSPMPLPSRYWTRSYAPDAWDCPCIVRVEKHHPEA